MTEPLTDQQLDDIEQRANARRTALSGWINCYSPLSEQDALENAEAVLEEDVPVLLAEIRRQHAALPEPEPEAIHTHFGLTYANYLVLPRTLLQSMDDAWQTQFVALLDRLHEAFAHVPQAEAYEVTAGTQHIVGEMSESQLAQAGVEADWYAGETPPEGLSAEEFAEWQAKHETAEPIYHRGGEELDPHSRVLIPCADPVPHYNRGRAYIEPAAASAGAEDEQ